MLGQFISNAVKYCDKEPEIRIHVEKREENRKKMWILYIEDNGCGVKACDLPYIFDKGFTGSDINVSKKPTGMGLYLAREMATDLLCCFSTGTSPFSKKFRIIPRLYRKNRKSQEKSPALRRGTGGKERRITYRRVPC